MQFQRKVLAAKTICIPLLLVASLALSCISFAQNRRHDRYSFACNSHHFMLEDFEKEPVVHSPNGRNTVQLTKDYKVRVATSGAKGCSCSYCPSLMPTSRSTGRLIPVSFSSRTATVPVSGPITYTCTAGSEILGESRVPEVVAEQFKAKYCCEPRGNNLFFLSWTADSSSAFLVAEVFPTGDCGKKRNRISDTLSMSAVRRFCGRSERRTPQQLRKVAGVLESWFCQPMEDDWREIPITLIGRAVTGLQVLLPATRTIPASWYHKMGRT